MVFGDSESVSQRIRSIFVRFDSFNYSPRKYKHLKTIERKRRESFKELGVYLFF